MRHVILVAALMAAPLGAQGVGHLPTQSPYEDLPYKQEFSFNTGWYSAGKDRVGVAPRSGPYLGMRYEVRVGGPAQFTARVGHVRSERRLLDPSRPVGSRDRGMTESPLWIGDASLSLNLTGQKSYRDLVPLLNLGIGIASDFAGEDVGGFKFGTQFAFSVGGGVRWVPGGHWALRADLADYMYQITYPNSYFLSSDGSAPVSTGSQSDWTHNLALTVGASYRFYR